MIDYFRWTFCDIIEVNIFGSILRITMAQRSEIVPVDFYIRFTIRAPDICHFRHERPRAIASGSFRFRDIARSWLIWIACRPLTVWQVPFSNLLWKTLARLLPKASSYHKIHRTVRFIFERFSEKHFVDWLQNWIIIVINLFQCQELLGYK